MAGRTQVGKEHFMKTVHDELAKFEQKEIEFQKNGTQSARGTTSSSDRQALSSTVQIRYRRWCRHVPILKGFVICVSNAHVFIAPCLGVANLLPDSSVHLAIK
jgi:hypothetical protein